MRFRIIIYSVLIISILVSVQTFAATYYVDATGGNDSSIGKSTDTAWKTLNKVNGFAFLAGDTILFKRGETWYGQLNISKAGMASNVIIYSAYHTGNKPLIIGGAVVRDAIFVRASHIVVDGFATTNYDGADIFDGKEAKRTGIRIGQWGMSLTNIKILNNEVYFVEGCSNHQQVGAPRGTDPEDENVNDDDPANNNQYQNGAIYADPTNINGLTIQGNYVHDCTNTGIFASIYGSSSNVVIRSNSVYNVGSDGIQIWNSQSPLIELNAVIKAGNNSGTDARDIGELGFNGLAVCGMWAFHCSSPLFQYNYCEGTKVIKYDGQAWDFDIGVSGNAIYQYNLSRDNEGGFNLGGESSFIFRYNISFNDGSKQGQGEGFFNGSSQYYNNVFYRNDGRPFHFDSYIKCTGAFKNNIFYSNASSSANYQNQGRTFSNNCFNGHTPTNSGTSAVLSDALLVDPDGVMKVTPGQILTLADFCDFVNGFKLTSGSSCINSGINISNNGGKDLWDLALYNDAPDIGVNEFGGTITNITNPLFTVSTKNIRIYPNPVICGAVFTIDGVDTKETSVIQISDLSGKVVFSKITAMENDVYQLNTSGLAKGVYLVQVKNDHQTLTRKLIIK